MVGGEPGAARSGPGRHNRCHDHRSAAGDADSLGRPVMIPLTGRQYPIGAGPYSAVVTELGAGLRELTHQGEHVIAGYQPDELPPGAAGQLLVPWPNRIDRGRYSASISRQNG